MVGLESRSRGRDWASRLKNRTLRKKPLGLIIFLAVIMICFWHLVYFIFQRASEPSAREFCVKAVDRLVEEKIRFVAIDFDQTIIDIHTGGRWKGSAADLVPHVRPDFQCYISQCLERKIHVAVATFSGQTALIRTVLEQAIPHSKIGTIAVFGNDAYVENHTKGKQSQLLMAVDHFSQPSASPIDRTSTLLIDDDPRNIRIARKDGYRTIRYDPEDKKRLFHSDLSKS